MTLGIGSPDFGNQFLGAQLGGSVSFDPTGMAGDPMQQFLPDGTVMATLPYDTFVDPMNPFGYAPAVQNANMSVYGAGGGEIAWQMPDGSIMYDQGTMNGGGFGNGGGLGGNDWYSNYQKSYYPSLFKEAAYNNPYTTGPQGLGQQAENEAPTQEDVQNIMAEELQAYKEALAAKRETEQAEAEQQEKTPGMMEVLTGILMKDGDLGDIGEIFGIKKKSDDDSDDRDAELAEKLEQARADRDAAEEENIRLRRRERERDEEDT
ncbi:MAG: hypothetical protein KTR14_02705 [Vampirovibrio sp.]|nr:hypothetical protein [Vampirovibrio sp.]